MGSKNVDQIRKRNIFVWLGLSIGCVGFFYLTHHTLGPFLLGLSLAYLLHPLVDRLEALYVPRWLSSLIVVTCVIVLFLLFWLFFIPFVGFQLQTILQRLQAYTQSFFVILKPRISFALERMHNDPLLQQSEKLLPTALQNGLSWLTQHALSLLPNAEGIARFLFYLLVAPFVLFYGLIEWHSITTYAESLIPQKVRTQWRAFFTRLDKNISGYVRGQMLVCLSIGAYLSLCFTLLHLPYGFLLGIVTGLLTFIPYVGMLSGSITALLLTAVHMPTWFSFLSLTLVLLGGQVLEAAVLIPFFIGRRVGMHPVWVLFAIFASGALLGFWGVLFALPIATFCHSLVHEALTFYQRTAFFETLSDR